MKKKHTFFNRILLSAVSASVLLSGGTAYGAGLSYGAGGLSFDGASASLENSLENFESDPSEEVFFDELITDVKSFVEPETPAAGGANLSYGAGALQLSVSADGTILASSGLTTSILGGDLTEHASVRALEARLEANSQLYKGLAICQCANYVNIRAKADTESEVMGKIYNKSAAHILETVHNDTGTWYKVRSGQVTGHIKADYFAVGDDAIALSKKVGSLVATVNTETLRLRAEPSLESEAISLISAGEKYYVTKEDGDFVRLSIDDDLEGWVSRSYITLKLQFTEAISTEEEKAEAERKARLERERLEAEEEARRERNRRNEQRSTQSTTTKHSSGSGNKSTKSEGGSIGSRAGKVSGTRKALCAYAESFVGNLKYVYGGNSLNTGTDCSGFTKLVYQKYGISLPRCSDDQGYCGERVSSAEMRPGDIIYYGGHVAIYVGDGMVVHCSSAHSNPNTKMSVWNYRTPKRIVNVFGD